MQFNNTTYMIIGLVICIVYVVASLIIQKKEKNEQLRQELSLFNRLRQQNQEKQQELAFLQKEKQNCQNQIIELKSDLLNIQKEIDKELDNQELTLAEAYADNQKHCTEAFSHYAEALEAAYEKEDLNFKNKINKLKEEQLQAQNQLAQIKGILQAASAAEVRSKLEQDKKDYYKIQLTQSQLKDIQFLQDWKNRLSDPTLVSKIVWSSIVMKATSALCSRVLETNTAVCGIYKITNLITGQIYIGQSTDIASRWKTHIKYGLGIDAPSTNKLYNNMQDYGVWHFTFQLLQKCPREKLNEKERFWIETYSANIMGLNSTKGNDT